uniref:ARAD1D01254p n=1 Tax=Blastobotrys adeninivorans TaxID=409370 RepID=A0A060TCP6_BLAAD
MLALKRAPARALNGKRFASTKIPVQLLKDFPGLGYRGEIVHVKPGRMRNELHVNNGAAYLVKGAAPRIPVVSREEIDARRAKEEESKKTKEKKIQEQLAKEKQERELQQRQKRVSHMTNLLFNKPAESSGEKATAGAAPGADAYVLSSAMSSLPKTLHIKWTTAGESDSALDIELSTVDIANHLSILLGHQVKPSYLKFNTESGNTIDKVGSYQLSVLVPGSSEKVLNIAVSKSKDRTGYDPKVRAAAQQQPSEESTPSPKEKPASSESTNKQTGFAWENQVITDMEERLKR